MRSLRRMMLLFTILVGVTSFGSLTKPAQARITCLRGQYDWDIAHCALGIDGDCAGCLPQN